MPKDSINVGGKKYIYEYEGSDMKFAIQHLKNTDKRGLSPEEAKDLFENAAAEAMRSPTGTGNAHFQDELGRNFSIEAKRIPGIFTRGTPSFKLVQRKE